MARAIVVGLGRPVGVTDGGSGRAAELAELVGGQVHATNRDLAGASDLLILCHKPAQLNDVAGEIAEFDGVVASCLAATSTEALEAALPRPDVVRVMPNTPVEVRAGVICVSTGGAAAPAARTLVTELFETLGTVIAVAEDEMELATAIGGCAPAFYALFAQELAAAAVARGMDPELARTIAGDALAGSGSLLRERAYDTDRVQREVASPGGLTEKALKSFDDQGLNALVGRAVDAVLGKD